MKQDFVNFFRSLKETAAQLRLHFSPDYLMMDANDPTYNAAEQEFPDATLLMCYFHMKMNVRKNCPSMFKSDEEMTQLDDMIHSLHMSKSSQEYDVRVKEFKKTYKPKLYKNVYDYITKQWIDNRFSEWQIFHSPPGFANTNSNIESFNRQIKGFTEKKRLSVFGMLKKCEEMVLYYSIQQNYFNEYPKYIAKLNTLALACDKGLFKKVSFKLFAYKTWTINRSDRTCSCRAFCKNAICTHSLAFSHLKDLSWFGPKYSKYSKEFV